MLGWCMDNPALAPADTGYRRPPKTVTDVLDAPPPPAVVVTPTREHLILVQGVRYPSIADVAAPMLRLAGLRINPQTNGPHLPPRVVGLAILTVSDGARRPVPLPAVGHFGPPDLSPDGRRFAMTNTTGQGIELWVGDVVGATVRRIE